MNIECLFCNGDCPIHNGMEGECDCLCHTGMETTNCTCCDLPVCEGLVGGLGPGFHEVTIEELV